MKVKLSLREQEVLGLVMQGKSNIEIANTLVLSPRTIESYLSFLREKTGTRNRVELLIFAMKHHLLK